MSKEYKYSPEDSFIIQWNFLQGNERTEFVENFLNDNPHLADSIDDLITQAEAVILTRDELSPENREAIYAAVADRIDKKHKRKIMLITWSSVAAVLFIGFFSMKLLKTLNNGVVETMPVLTEDVPEELFMEKEIQIISGQQRTAIADNSNIEITENARALVSNDSVRQQELVLDAATINTIIVPYGKRSSLTLPDGTRVWLNAGSRLDFPSRFDGRQREIHVSGEMYLIVREDSLKPFMVNTDRISIQVLGTTFNVTAYPSDTIQAVVLVEGNVKVSGGNEVNHLLPGEKIDIGSNAVVREAVDVSPYISWTRGILEFNNSPIPEILKKVGRYYNVDFNVSPALMLDEKSWSGKLFLSESLDNVMTSITTILSIGYYRINNTIYLTEN